MSFPNLKCNSFVCYHFSNWEFHVQLSFITDKHDKLWPLTLTLKVILLCYLCIYEFSYSVLNVWFKKSYIPNCDLIVQTIAFWQISPRLIRFRYILLRITRPCHDRYAFHIWCSYSILKSLLNLNNAYNLRVKRNSI